MIVPVPLGYTVSEATDENTVSGGLVIYEGDEAITDDNVIDARINRNQFVWVPVNNVNEMFGIDSNGKKWGKLYSFSEDGITARNWSEKDGKMSIIDSASVLEPEITPNETWGDTDERIAEMGIPGVTTVDEFKRYLEEDFNAMIDSIKKYKGFFIGRYETGNLSQEKAVIVKNNNDLNNQSWYTMYKQAREVAANDNIVSSMIYGCQWDAVMRWMYNSGDIEKKKYTYDSSNKGNYKGTQNGTSKLISSGVNEEYKINNIYDMAGNVAERTIEASDRKTTCTWG